jgi:Lon-like protease
MLVQHDSSARPDIDITVRPPSVRPWLILLAVLALVGAAMVIPVPSLLKFVPGPVRDVERLIEVEGTETFSSEGTLFLTTVRVDESVTIADWVASFFESETTIIDKQSFTQGLSLNELNRLQRQEMVASKRAAASVALNALGIEERAGVEVANVLAEPAEGELRDGEVISSIDGDEVGTGCDLLATLSRHSPGEVVELQLKGRSKARSLDLRLGSAPNSGDRAFIGIEMAPDDFGSIDFQFRTGRIAGPSAGLMFSLALYDRLTPEDLTGGRRIAGTGTISCDGTVGEIGGVTQKVAGAEAMGAEVFLAPAGNLAEAQAAARDIRVISVGTFQDAVQQLESIH